MARLLLILGIRASALCKEPARCCWVVPDFATSCPVSPYPPGSSARLERRGAGTFGGGRRHLRYKRSGSGFNLTSSVTKGFIAKCSTPATIGTPTATYHLPPAKGVVIIGPRTLYERGLSGIRTLIEVQPPVERAFLIGAPRKGSAEATQLEEHRRAIRRKISVLKRRLEDVADHRANQRQGRRPCPSAALVGYTNAGKSSILRALSGDDIFVEDRLFATLDTLTREVDVGGGYRFRLADTVGFIRKLPHHLVASFRATLEEARGADVLLHVIDAAHPAWEEQAEVVDRETRIAEGGTWNDDASVVGRKRVVYVFNKADLLPDPEAFLAQVRER